MLFTVLATGCTAEGQKARLLERAGGYYKAGELDKARIEYFNVLRADPQNATAIQRLGFIWFEQGAPLRALSFLIKARDQAPNNIETRTKLASAFMSLGQIAEARKEALAILQQEPASGEAIILVADTVRTQAEIEETDALLRDYPQRADVSFHLASAKLLLLKRDLPAATSALERALAQDPKSIAAHLAMATFHLARKDRDQAGKEFKIATDLAPARSPARLRYAEFTAQSGAAEEAKTFLKDLTRQAPDYLPAWSLLAKIALSEKQYDEALALIGNVFVRDPEYLDARMLQSQIWLAKGEVKKAVEGLEGLNMTYANAPALKYQLARAYLLDKNPTQAAAVLTQAVTLNPDYDDAILLLGEVNLRAGEAAPVAASMQRLLTRHPNLLQAQLILADAYRVLGKPDDAAAIFRAQIAADPKAVAAYLRLGTILREQKKLAEARKAFETARELAPENSAAAYQLVELDILSADLDAALRRADQLIAKAPQEPGAHLLKGRVHAARGEVDQAEAALLKTLELDPNAGGAYDSLIGTYIAANRLPQALRQLEDVLAKNPANGSALMLAALTYEKTGANLKSRDAYEKLIVLKPEFTPALNNLAYLYADRLNQLDKAYPLARKARTLQPGDGSIADTLGWILYKQADYQQALALLAEGAAKLPDSAEIQFHLGMASYMMGQTDAARSAFQQALTTTAEFPGKEEAQRCLALLGEVAGKTADLSTAELEALVKERPNDLVAQVKLAESYENQGAVAKAAAAYEQALKLNSKLLSATVKLAQLNAGPLQSPAIALEFARKARELAPTDPKVAGTLGGIAYQTGNGAWAYSLLQESARELPDDAGILRDYAWAAYGLGKVREAREIMQRIPDKSPASREADDARVFLAMTATDQSPKDLTAAEPEAERILKAEPGYVPALMVRAAMQTQRGDAKAAAAGYSEVLRRFPDFSPAQQRLAAVWMDDLQKRPSAYDLAVKARKTLPDDPELGQVLGQLHYHRGEFASAVRLFQESAKRQPLDAKSLYCLGQSHLQTKQKAEGLEALQRAVDAGLPEPLSSDAKRVLAGK